MSCSKCLTHVLDKDSLQCMVCRKVFHYLCAGKTEENFKKMGKATKQWKCATCKVIGGTDNDDDLKLMIKELSKDIKDQLKDFEKSLQYNSGKLDDVVNGFSEMKKAFSSLQKKQEELEQENVTLKKKVKELNWQVQIMDQRTLDHNLEISGIPDSVDDSQVIISALCRKINVPCPDATSYVLKRAPVGAPGKPKPIVAMFTSKQKRDIILKECKKAKPKVSDITNKSSDVQPVFVNEQLSAYNKQLFFKANQAKKEKGYAYLWVSEGRILLKKSNESRVVRIQCLEDLPQ